MKNDQFTFVNDIEADIEEQSNIVVDDESFKNERPGIEAISADERWERVKLVKTIIIMLVASAGIFAFSLIWQDSTSLLAICNGLCLVVLLEFAAGWMILMNNLNIISPLIYGAKTFGKMILGKRIDDDYYSYAKRVEENPLPKYMYRVCFIAALINAIPSVILLFIVSS